MIRCLRRIYKEIDDYTRLNDAEKLAADHWVTGLIRRTRFVGFYLDIDPADWNHYMDLNAVLTRTSFENAETRNSIMRILQEFLDVVEVDQENDDQESDDQETDDHKMNERLWHFVGRCGYPVLSICLRSAEFYRILRDTSGDFEHIRWAECLGSLSLNRGSIELFARLRNIDFMAQVREPDHDFQLLLSHVFRKYNHTVSGHNFGALPDELREVHPNLNKQHTSFGHWALPVERDANDNPVTVCTISYEASQDLHRDFPDMAIDEAVTEVQESITESIVLAGYTWPKQEYWPSDDPRECGYSEVCMCCNRVRGPIPETNDRTRHGESCTCTLEQYISEASLPGAPLYELQQSDAGVDVGVRALQNFRPDEVLGEYVGEIYPLAFSSRYAEASLNPQHCRYSGPEGDTYRMEQDAKKRTRIGDADDAPTPKRARLGRAAKTANLADDEDLKELKGEYKSYNVDAAIKGNWTRFINHSCDPNTSFEPYNIGGKWRTLIQANRNIAFGEWLSVYYCKLLPSPAPAPIPQNPLSSTQVILRIILLTCPFTADRYFDDKSFGCKCGSAACLLWPTTSKCLRSSNTQTLFEACDAGNAPDWVRDFNANLPETASKEERLPFEASRYWAKCTRDRVKEIKKRQKGREKSVVGKQGKVGEQAKVGKGKAKQKKTANGTRNPRRARGVSLERQDDDDEEEEVEVEKAVEEEVVEKQVQEEEEEVPETATGRPKRKSRKRQNGDWVDEA